MCKQPYQQTYTFFIGSYLNTPIVAKGLNGLQTTPSVGQRRMEQGKICPEMAGLVKTERKRTQPLFIFNGFTSDCVLPKPMSTNTILNKIQRFSSFLVLPLRSPIKKGRMWHGKLYLYPCLCHTAIGYLPPQTGKRVHWSS